MTETEFLHETDALFAHIEDALDEGGWDADCLQSGNVLTIEASDGRQVVVNRHTPNRELWIASKLGGHHFAKRDGRWLAAKDGSEFFAVLNAALSDVCGETVTVPPV